MENDSIEKLKSILNNEQLPDELKNILSSMNNNSQSTESPSPSDKISQDTISNLISMFKSSSNTEETSNSGNTTSSNIDFETIIKLKSIMEKMNSKDDPRSKLLISLKPYLKESRKNKIDQYIQFLNMSNVLNLFSNGDDKK